MYNKIRIYQKQILTVILILTVLLFCFILYKSYKISKIKENTDILPVIQAKSNNIKIKNNTKLEMPEINSFYGTVDNLEDAINIIDDGMSINTGVNDITNELNNTINNIINNEKKAPKEKVVVDQSIKTVIINEDDNNKNNDKITTIQETENDRSYFKTQLVALKNKQQAHNFIEATKKQCGGLLKNLNIFIFEIDLGEKGIFYRVQVGNFNTRADALRFCNEYLKITTGDLTNCMVVR